MSACAIQDPVLPLRPPETPAKGPVLDHPVQVWWRHSPDLNESSWDYFHPVDTPHEPLLVTQAPRNNHGRFWEPETITRVQKPYGQLPVVPSQAQRQSRFYSPALASRPTRYHLITMPPPSPPPTKGQGKGGASSPNGKAKPEAASGGDGATQYAIFLGNFSTRAEADMITTHIWALGYPTIRRELGDDATKTIYQVQAGPYDTKKEAEQAFEHLKKDALKVDGGEEIDGVIVPFSKNKF